MVSVKSIIPKNWQIISTAELFDFIPTGSHSRDQMDFQAGKNTTYNIHYGDIHTSYGRYIDFKKDKIPTLKTRQATVREQLKLREGDLVMADASEDYDGVGAATEIRNIGNNICIAGLHTFALRTKTDQVALGYRTLLLRHPEVHNRLKQMSTYSKVYGITKKSFSELNFKIPSVEEQERIVAVLEVWDEYLEKLEQKIAELNQINTKTIEKISKLATTKYPMSKLGSYITSSGPRNKSLKIQNVLSVSNRTGFTSPKDLFSRDIASLDLSNYKIVTKNEFAYNPSRINVGSISRLKTVEKCIVSPMYIVFKVNEEKLCPEYFDFVLTTKRFKGSIIASASGSVRASVDFKSFCSIKIALPPISDQQKYSKDFLETKKLIEKLINKYKLIETQKKFLLDNLVTGKIRTPENMEMTKKEK